MENLLHIGTNGHCSDIQKGKIEKPMAAHFNLPDHSLQDLQVMRIEKIQRDDAAQRKLRESNWIYTLGTLASSGMNLDS